MTTPGLVGEWSARDLIAHLGYWAGHAAEVIHRLEQGRIEEDRRRRADRRRGQRDRRARRAHDRRWRRCEARGGIGRGAGRAADAARPRAARPRCCRTARPWTRASARTRPSHYREHAEELRARPRGAARWLSAMSLLADLDAARDAFHDVLADVDADLATVPGVMEDWSVRDIVFHVAVWCGARRSEALALAAAGRGDEFAYSSADTDAMNARFLARGPRRSRRRGAASRGGGLRRVSRADRRSWTALLGPSARQRRHGRRGHRLRRPRALRRAHRPPARLVRSPRTRPSRMSR